MEIFATVDALQKGWKTLGDDELEAAETLLKRASAQIVTLTKNHGVIIDISDEIQMINLETVTCNIVRRVLDSMGGVQSASQGIGVTSASLTFANPDMSLYLSKSDRELLGIAGKSTYRAVQAHTWADDKPCITPGVPFRLSDLKAVDNA